MDKEILGVRCIFLVFARAPAAPRRKSPERQRGVFASNQPVSMRRPCCQDHFVFETSLLLPPREYQHYTALDVVSWSGLKDGV